MANLLQAILDPPAFHHLSFKEMQKRRLFNRGCLAGAVFCLFFTVVGFSFGQYKLAFLTAFDLLALLTGIAINTSGNFSFARHLSFNASTILFVGSNYFYGSIIHTEIYIFVFPAITVFVFDDKKIIAAYCAYLLGLFMLCLYFQKHFTGTIDGNAELLSKFSYMNYVFAFSLLTILVYSFKSESIENNEKMLAQKLAIEEKSKEITDSINYAKRIQTAMMTSEDVLHKYYLTKYFLFFKPKDIVSGDFYWSARKENRIYQAVCDCTGHGVPGAFMSLLITSYLNEAIIEKNISKPNEVFDWIRKKLIATISQDGGKDGMDGILFCKDLITDKVTYAAAFNVPYLIHNGQLTELKSDKMPVGIGETDRPFTLFETELQPGDCLYLSTDGYADQFGGPKGKKLKYKQLEEILLSISHLDMNEQKNILERKFEEWKGNHEQVDDVLIVGIMK